ncbi:unnamed protein product [Amoebophrya sp. A120]|nr:unnamed protein product [Amoebophrya sp. A120]|eukprot:GSA120T00024202001.1
MSKQRLGCTIIFDMICKMKGYGKNCKKMTILRSQKSCWSAGVAVFYLLGSFVILSICLQSGGQLQAVSGAALSLQGERATATEQENTIIGRNEKKLNIVFAGGFLDTEMMQAILPMKVLSEHFADKTNVFFLNFSPLLAARVEKSAPNVVHIVGPEAEKEHWLGAPGNTRTVTPTLRRWLLQVVKEKMENRVDYWIADWISPFPEFASETFSPDQVAQSVWFGNSEKHAMSIDSRAAAQPGGWNGPWRGQNRYVEWVPAVTADATSLPSLRTEGAADVHVEVDQDEGLVGARQHRKKTAPRVVGRVFPLHDDGADSRPFTALFSSTSGKKLQPAGWRPPSVVRPRGQQEVDHDLEVDHCATYQHQPDVGMHKYLREIELAADGRKIVYFSLGTLFDVDQRTWDAILADLTRLNATEYYVVLRLSLKMQAPEDEQAAENKLFPNMRLERNLIDQAAFLCYFGAMSRSNDSKNSGMHPRFVFVSHCGMSSVNEALQARVPLVGLPYQNEQTLNATALARAKVGVYVKSAHHILMGRRGSTADGRGPQSEQDELNWYYERNLLTPDALVATSITDGIGLLVGGGPRHDGQPVMNFERLEAAMLALQARMRAEAFDPTRAAELMLHIARTKLNWRKSLRHIARNEDHAEELHHVVPTSGASAARTFSSAATSATDPFVKLKPKLEQIAALLASRRKRKSRPLTEEVRSLFIQKKTNSFTDRLTRGKAGPEKKHSILVEAKKEVQVEPLDTLFAASCASTHLKEKIEKDADAGFVGDLNRACHGFLKNPSEVTAMYGQRDTMENQIPRRLVQTAFFKDESNCTREEFYAFFQCKDPVMNEGRKIWQALNPDFELAFFNLDEARQYLSEHYQPRVLRAFDSVEPNQMKSDFFRLLTLYRHGGVYMDHKIAPVQAWDAILETAFQGTKKFRKPFVEYHAKEVPEVGKKIFEKRRSEMTSRHDVGFLGGCQDFGWINGSKEENPAGIQFSQPEGLMNAFLAAKPGNELVGDLLYVLLANLEAKYHGRTPFDPTGPTGLWTALLRAPELVVEENGTTGAPAAGDPPAPMKSLKLARLSPEEWTNVWEGIPSKKFPFTVTPELVPTDDDLPLHLGRIPCEQYQGGVGGAAFILFDINTNTWFANRGDAQKFKSGDFDHDPVQKASLQLVKKVWKGGAGEGWKCTNRRDGLFAGNGSKRVRELRGTNYVEMWNNRGFYKSEDAEVVLPAPLFPAYKREDRQLPQLLPATEPYPVQMQAARQTDSSRPTCPPEAPKVYVYPLPDKVQLPNGRTIVWREDAYCERAHPSGSAGERDCVFGPEFSVTIDAALVPLQETTKVTLRSTDQFRMGRIFQSRLTRTACQVADATHADVFFVPIWRENYKPDPAECPTAAEVLRALPYLSDNTARQHFLMSPRVGGLSGDDVCDFWKSDEPLIQKIRKLALEDEYALGGNRPERAIPYPTLGAGLTNTQLDHLFTIVDATQQTGRPSLVMAALGKRAPGHAAAGVRDLWNAQCRDHSDDCVAVDPTVEGMLPGLVKAMLRSTFCLQPEGDTPSRKGMLDSLALGCIPVLSSEKQQKLWRWHLGNYNWKDFSVLAPGSLLAPGSSSTTVVEFLRAIGADTVKELQAAGRIARTRFLTRWSDADSSSDAIAVTLEVSCAAKVSYYSVGIAYTIFP